MENVMTNGFAELSENEVEMINGGEVTLHGGTDGIYIEISFSYKEDIYKPMYNFGGWLYDQTHKSNNSQIKVRPN